MDTNMMPFGYFGSRDGTAFQSLVQAYAGEREVEKALTTGNGIVGSGNTTSAQPLRKQFLSGELEQVSFELEQAALIKDIVKKPVGSTTAEWSDLVSYGGPGNGFVGETGYDGNFNVTGGDDNFLRQTQNVKFMATYRQVSSVAQEVNSIADPMKVAQNAAMLELVAKMNLALYYANAGRNILEFNGIEQQIIGWANLYPTDQAILYDAGGRPLDKELISDIARTCKLLYGMPSELRLSATTYSETQKTLFPEARYTEGAVTGAFGMNKDECLTPFGNIKMKYDIMLRANRPLVADGAGVDGKPRTSGTADAGALAFASTPFAACAAQAAGTGYFWQYANQNSDTAILGTAPNVPKGAGNNSNRLAAGSYLYAMSAVYFGKEGAAWVHGSDGTVGNATVISPTAGQIVKIDADITTPAITGLGTTYARNSVFFRVYRAPSTATSLVDFDWLMDIGIPTSGNARGYDNGYRIPGTDTGFMMTEKKGGTAAYFLGQLLPVFKKTLPINALSDQMALIAFITPIVRVGRHHVVVRNIGNYTG